MKPDMLEALGRLYRAEARDRMLELAQTHDDRARVELIIEADRLEANAELADAQARAAGGSPAHDAGVLEWVVSILKGKKNRF